MARLFVDLLQVLASAAFQVCGNQLFCGRTGDDSSRASRSSSPFSSSVSASVASKHRFIGWTVRALWLVAFFALIPSHFHPAMRGNAQTMGRLQQHDSLRPVERTVGQGNIHHGLDDRFPSGMIPQTAQGTIGHCLCQRIP